MNINHVIIGHSERRSIFGENDQLIKQKIEVAIKNKLHVIFCCGEGENERKKNNHIDFVMKQLEQSIFHLSKELFHQIIIAYEPIWAIGTGLNATPDQAQEMHVSIRKNIEKKYTKEIADSTSILYGGSCKPSNAADLFKCADIDGGLIGGASLIARDFISIAKAIPF
jgi:triosephosphate isomerase